MSEHLVPHVEGYMLGDPCVYVTFRHSDEVGKKRYSKRCYDICDKQSQIPPYQSFVDDLTCQYGRQKTEYR